jgi:hypothetical protein
LALISIGLSVGSKAERSFCNGHLTSVRDIETVALTFRFGSEVARRTIGSDVCFIRLCTQKETDSHRPAALFIPSAAAPRSSLANGGQEVKGYGTFRV